LGCDLLGEIVDAGGVAARPGKAGDKTKLDRVFSDAEDNRDRRGRSFGCLGSKVAGRRGDNGDAPAHEVSHERWQTIELALQPMVLHRHVLALDVAGLVKALAKRGGKGRIGRPGIDESDGRHRWLLGARLERPSGSRAAEQRDEFATFHVEHRGLPPLCAIRAADLARFRLNLPMRPMPPVALDIGGYKALRLANAVRIGTLDANNRPTANSYALHKPSLRIIIVHGIMLSRPVVPHGNGVRRPVKPELIFGNEC